ARIWHDALTRYPKETRVRVSLYDSGLHPPHHFDHFRLVPESGEVPQSVLHQLKIKFDVKDLDSV
ncbi:hypothetical protein V8F44DRAFT_455173, partial [Aspergillus fumigatus]